MPNTNLVDDELLKLWQKVACAEMFAHHVPALLGREDSGGGFTIPVSAWPGFVYVRRFQAGALTVDKAINRAGVIERGDLPIWLDRDADGRWIVIGERYTGGEMGVPVVARYSTNAGQSIPNVTDTIVNFEDVTFDPWGAVTVGASWKFTAPAHGYYLVTPYVRFNTLVWAAGNVVVLKLFLNGALAMSPGATYAWNATAIYLPAGGTTLIELAEGDYIDIRVNQNRGAASALIADATHNHIHIARLR